VGGGWDVPPNIASSWAAWICSSRLDYIRRWIQIISPVYIMRSRYKRGNELTIWRFAH
jgi:hypothetical protein